VGILNAPGYGHKAMVGIISESGGCTPVAPDPRRVAGGSRNEAHSRAGGPRMNASGPSTMRDTLYSSRIRTLNVIARRTAVPGIDVAVSIPAHPRHDLPDPED
jgi:hypothetical protein